MQEIKGRITAIENDQLIIAVEDEEQCHACGLKNNCKNTTLTLDRTPDTFQLQSGQDVLVTFGRLLKSSFLLYMFPLIALFAGTGLTAWFAGAENELLLFTGGMAALTVSLLLLKVLSPVFNREEYKIQIKPLT